MPLRGRGRCGREISLRSCTNALAFDYQAMRGDICYAAQSGGGDSTNQNALTEVERDESLRLISGCAARRPGARTRTPAYLSAPPTLRPEGRQLT
jgi:hypothetical protein